MRSLFHNFSILREKAVAAWDVLKITQATNEGIFTSVDRMIIEVKHEFKNERHMKTT